MGGRERCCRAAPSSASQARGASVGVTRCKLHRVTPTLAVAVAAGRRLRQSAATAGPKSTQPGCVSLERPPGTPKSTRARRKTAVLARGNPDSKPAPRERSRSQPPARRPGSHSGWVGGIKLPLPSGFGPMWSVYTGRIGSVASTGSLRTCGVFISPIWLCPFWPENDQIWLKMVIFGPK